jgi:hypothetical protein
MSTSSSKILPYYHTKALISCQNILHYHLQGTIEMIRTSRREFLPRSEAIDVFRLFSVLMSSPPRIEHPVENN